MKTKLLILVTLLISIKGFSQVVYENGYFLDENDQKTDCLIRNVDWRYNPKEFEYKLSHDSETRKATIQSVKEFGIYNSSKYRRTNVRIDRSSNDYSKLTIESAPVFEDEVLFLKVLVEGNASLFSYEESNFQRFFFAIKGGEVLQLIYKLYRVDHSTIGTNDQYKAQLISSLDCEGITKGIISRVRYHRKDLEELFMKYNRCKDPLFEISKAKVKRNILDVTLRPGINLNSLSASSGLTDSRNIKLDPKLQFRAGIETEFILPFNKNKWAVFVEPTYRTFKSESISSSPNVSGGKLISKVNYSSLELPIGVRYYFYLNGNSKIFINAALLLDFTFDSSIKWSRADGSTIIDMELSPIPNMAAGVGYKFRNKYSVELRYLTDREILSNYVYWNSNYKTTSLIFGYTIF